MDPSDANLLFTASLTATRFSTFASLAFLVYDHVLTLDAEIEFVWRRAWSFGKVMFIFNRYFGLAVLAFNSIVHFYHSPTHSQFCEIFRAWTGIAVMLAVMSAEVILMARIYAVYDRSKRVLIIMAVLFAVNIMSSAMIIFLSPPGGTRSPPKALPGCFVVDQAASFFICWIPAFTFETILFSMMLYRGWGTLTGKLSSPLMNVVIRDSIVYFIIIFAALFANCLTWALSPQTFNVELSGCWTIASSCAFGSRLLLNIRERYFSEQTHVSCDTELGYKAKTTSSV